LSRSAVTESLIILLSFSLVSAPAVATLESGSQAPSSEVLVGRAVSHAVVTDTVTGQPVCKVALGTRPELLPAHLVGVSGEIQARSPLADLKECDAQAIEVVRQIAERAGEGFTQTAVLGLAALSAVNCFVAILAGVDSVLYYEKFVANPHRPYDVMAKQDKSLGLVTGTEAALIWTGIPEFPKRISLGFLFKTLGMGVYGFLCGGLGGLGGYAVIYLSSHS
jgi:hypothetical protein